MTELELTPAEMKINREIAGSLVGLIEVLTAPDGEDARLLGSATLVTIKGRRGLLTAAHVLNVIPRTHPLGIVRFSSPNTQRLLVQFHHALRISIGRTNEGPQGPDLGFIELPSEAIASLEARGNIFFNMDLRRDDVLAGRYEAKPHLGCIVGAIAERTTESVGPSERTKNIGACNLLGKIGAPRTHDGFDLVDFEPVYSKSDQPPSSFGGVSGGGLWRVMGVLENGSISAVDKVLLGVAFYQSAVVEGKRTLICHGPRSLYHELYEAVAPA